MVNKTNIQDLVAIVKKDDTRNVKSFGRVAKVLSYENDLYSVQLPSGQKMHKLRRHGNPSEILVFDRLNPVDNSEDVFGGFVKFALIYILINNPRVYVNGNLVSKPKRSIRTLDRDYIALFGESFLAKHDYFFK